MRLQKSIFIILMMLAVPVLAFAEQKSGCSQSRPPITLQKANKGGHAKGPKAPDRQLIVCTYDGMYMELNFAIPEGEATLIVSDETQQYLTYTIDTSTLHVSVPVGPMSGSINIDLETELDNHFSGVFE